MKASHEQKTTDNTKPPSDRRVGESTMMFSTLKKLKGRSIRELGVRGAQRLASYRSKISPPKVPSDSAFFRLLDTHRLHGGKVDAFNVAELFSRNSSQRFFCSLSDSDRSVELFKERFPGAPISAIVKRADDILEGRLNVLGYSNLAFGPVVEWRLDPVSGKSSDLRHWSLFDELDPSDTGDKKIVWEANRHQHFFTLGAAYLLTLDETYASTFADHIEGWMDQNPPELGVNWVSSLEVSLRAMSWIWALNFFKASPSVGAALQLKIMKYLYLHGCHIENHLSTYFSANTHLTGEALGLYYLGTQLSFLKCAERWRTLGEEILVGELDRQVLGDGVYFEQSFWYQRYTVDFYIHFLVLRALFTGSEGDDIVQRVREKTEKMAEFLMGVMRPDGTTPMVGDDDGGRALPHGSSRSDDFRAVLSTCAVLFGRGDFKYAAGQMLEETLWLLGTQGVLDYARLRAVPPGTTSTAFEKGGYFVMRGGLTETDDFMLIDCGELGSMNGAHGHADALSFELAVAGRTALVDSGTYTYHGSQELRDHFRSSGAHNTLTVDGLSQSEPGHVFGWKSRARARLHKWIPEERFDFFEGSHDGYERLESPVTHIREILHVKNDYWMMRDFADTDGSHGYSLNFHYNVGRSPRLSRLENGSWCVDDQSLTGEGLRLVVFGDNGAWNLEESWISRNHGERVNAPLLRYSSQGTGPQEFFTFMLPLEGDGRVPETCEEPVSGGRAFRLKFRTYDDLLVYSDTGFGVTIGRFATDFKFAWIRTGASGAPEELVLLDGGKLLIDGKTVVDSPTPLVFASIRVFGESVNVRTSESVYSVNLP